MMKIILIVALVLIVVLLVCINWGLQEIHKTLTLLTAHPLPVVDPVAQAISNHLSGGRQLNMNVVAGEVDEQG